MESKTLPKKVQEMWDFELLHCDNCNQETNHLKGICQKCKPKKQPSQADFDATQNAPICADEMSSEKTSSARKEYWSATEKELTYDFNLEGFDNAEEKSKVNQYYEQFNKDRQQHLKEMQAKDADLREKVRLLKEKIAQEAIEREVRWDDSSCDRLSIMTIIEQIDEIFCTCKIRFKDGYGFVTDLNCPIHSNEKLRETVAKAVDSDKLKKEVANE